MPRTERGDDGHDQDEVGRGTGDRDLGQDRRLEQRRQERHERGERDGQGESPVTTDDPPCARSRAACAKYRSRSVDAGERCERTVESFHVKLRIGWFHVKHGIYVEQPT